MRDENWLRTELREVVKTCKENARENRRQAKDCRNSEPRRAEFLEGGAEAMDHCVKEINRVLAGKTSLEAIVDAVKKGQAMRKKGLS